MTEKGKYVDKINNSYLPYIELQKLEKLLIITRKNLLEENDEGNPYQEGVEDFDNQIREMLDLL